MSTPRAKGLDPERDRVSNLPVGCAFGLGVAAPGASKPQRVGTSFGVGP